MKLAHLALWMAAVTLCLPIAGVCQEEPAQPEVDRTDPAAVAAAYVEACRTGDVKTALSLIHPDDPLRMMLSEAAQEMGGDMTRGGFTFTRVFAEFMFVPVEFGFESGDVAVQQGEDGATQVVARRTWVTDQKFVMAQAEDGTWSIKVAESIAATTGEDSSFLAMQSSGGPGAGMNPYESEGRLRRLAGAFSEYARAHDGLLPPAASWCDAIDEYVLDPELFECPALPEQEYGYAMNVLADEAELPDDWEGRRDLILLFEWRDAERNASAMPEEAVDMESPWPDGSVTMVDASENPRRVAAGMTLEDMAAAKQSRETCENHIRAFTNAALDFARDNDGLLPGPGTWQDDLALYLLEETGVQDIFRCPSAPDLDFAYAINSEIAGMDATEIRGHDRVILFFESDLNVPNAAGDPDTDVPPAGRHAIEWGTGLRNEASFLGGDTTHLRPPAPEGQ